MKSQDTDTMRPIGAIYTIIFRTLKEIFKYTPLSTGFLFIPIVYFALIPFINNFISGKLIDNLTQFAGAGVEYFGGQILTLVLIYFGLSIASSLLSAAQRYFYLKQYQTISEYFTLQFLKKASDLDLYHYENSESNDTIQKAKQAYQSRPQQLFDRFLSVIRSFLPVITSFGIIATFSFPLFIILLITSIPTLIINLRMSELSYGIWGANTETKRRYWDASGYLHSESSLMELRIFRTKSYLYNMVSDLYLGFFRKEQKVARSASLWDSVGNIIAELGSFILYGAYIFAVLNGDITVGTFSFYVSSTWGFSNSLTNLLRNLSSLREMANYMGDYYDFMSLKNIISSGTKKLRSSGKPPRIEFKHLDFHYPGTTDSPILDNFELTIEPGEKVAFVGENGAGKTTIIKLLSRFYDPTSGSILVDGEDLREIDVDEWYSQLGVLFQEFTKYNFMPVSESIGVGDIENINSIERVVESAKKSGADEFISKFQSGYNQILSKRYPGGVSLSGGQWQRVALARAFFRDAPILILDEPTSAIDPKGEAEIFDKLYEFTEGKTVIIISHRFSTVR